MTHQSLPSVHLRYNAKAFNAKGEHVGPGPWLNAIWTANEIDPEMFGEPESTGEWWAGGGVEEYAHARVIHRNDETVSIVPKTDHGADVLRQVAERENQGLTT